MTSVSDRVRGIMSDGKPRTAMQIAIEMEAKEYDVVVLAHRLPTMLRTMEKWGEIERVGYSRSPRGAWAFVWRWKA